MYKNQLQELAQRSCFNLPSYACIRQGPDHAPRFKASVNFNGEIFESPSYCTTVRQAEHAAAQVALNKLSTRGPSTSLTARLLDETGIYKNLLQETAHRAGLKLPVYTTVRSGPGHAPVFTCTVELASMTFTGHPAKTKKQAQKNAAIAAWSALKTNFVPWRNREGEFGEEEEQAAVTRLLSNLRPKVDDHNKSSKVEFGIRRRDPIQARRRFMVNKQHRDTASSSSSSSSSSSTSNSAIKSVEKQNDEQQWRQVMDDLLSSADLVIHPPQVSTVQNKQHMKSFSSLLPPPPPPTASKILAPPAASSSASASNFGTTSTIPVRVVSTVRGGSSQHPQLLNNNNNNIPPLLELEERQRDKEVENEKEAKTLNLNSSSTSIFGSSSAAVPYRQFPVKYGHGGGFSHLHRNRIAPAVQIRSVIPVCSAAPPSQVRPSPPPPPPPPQANPPLTLPTSSSKMMISMKDSTSTSSTKLKMPESNSNSNSNSNSTQLGSEFNKKLQLR